MRATKKLTYYIAGSKSSYNRIPPTNTPKFIAQDMFNALEWAEDNYGLYGRAFKGSRKVIIEVRIYPAPKVTK